MILRVLQSRWTPFIDILRSRRDVETAGTRINKIWVDGVEITGLRAGSHPFRLMEALARACPEGVSTDALAKDLSGARLDGDTPARQAKTQALKAIDQAMAAAGRSFDEKPIVSGPSGFYRCTLPAHIV